MNKNADASLTARAQQITDIQDAVKLADALAGQLGEAATREDALAVLLGLIGQGGMLRDEAAGLYVELIESGDGG